MLIIWASYPFPVSTVYHTPFHVYIYSGSASVIFIKISDLSMEKLVFLWMTLSENIITTIIRIYMWPSVKCSLEICSCWCMYWNRYYILSTYWKFYWIELIFIIINNRIAAHKILKKNPKKIIILWICTLCNA